MTRPPGGDVPGVEAPGPSPSRRLLAQIRDIMAGADPPQQRLDRIVRLIAAEMVAEVCSCYVRRPGDVLELFATVGLNPGAVHQTRLRIGEGLVGEIAATGRPLALADARGHPRFAYRPETGEDPFQSLMGVPIIRGGRVRGILVVQNRHRRHYHEEEIETLQTIAMVVAELIAGAVARNEIAWQEATGNIMPVRFAGASLNAGLACGVAVPHRPEVTIRDLVAEDPRKEQARLQAAIRAMHRSLDALLANSAAANLPESRDILEAYRMFAEDRGWHARIGEFIRAGLKAEAAIQRVREDIATRMEHSTDPYLNERLLDFDDLANRLLLHLAGRSAATEPSALPAETVLIARALGPAELLEYDHGRLRALVLEAGSATSHVIIIAKAMDIPVVGRCHGVLAQVEPLDPVIVDADNAQVFVRPTEDVQAIFDQHVTLRAERRRRHAARSQLPAESRDGVRVSLWTNAGLLADLGYLQDTGAEGIGLFRTEIPFLMRPNFPDVTVQAELYGQVLDKAEGRPVHFRTLDIGGDKALPYFGRAEEGNPALGWRAIRIGLDRPHLLRQQFRALIRAARGRPLNVMLPMVSEVAEVDAARHLLRLELAEAEAAGSPLPERLGVGAMLEVPAVIWQLPALISRVDFLAVGSNDLQQYLFASDRGDPELAQRYDPLSPPMLALLQYLVRQCDAADVPVSLCGEMAGRPLDAMALVGLGFRRLSMPTGAVGSIRAMVRSLAVAPLADYLAQLAGSSDHSLRPQLKAYARDHAVEV